MKHYIYVVSTSGLPILAESEIRRQCTFYFLRTYLIVITFPSKFIVANNFYINIISRGQACADVATFHMPIFKTKCVYFPLHARLMCLNYCCIVYSSWVFRLLCRSKLHSLSTERLMFGERWFWTRCCQANYRSTNQLNAHIFPLRWIFLLGWKKREALILFLVH